MIGTCAGTGTALQLNWSSSQWTEYVAEHYFYRMISLSGAVKYAGTYRVKEQILAVSL